MKSLQTSALALMGFALISCQTIVTRSPAGLAIQGQDKSLPAALQKDVFADYLWTAPPVASRALDFKDSTVVIPFGGEDLTFRIQQDGTMTLSAGGASIASSAVRTPNDHYYNRDILPIKTVAHQRMVSKTRTETERVAVSKTRSVQKQRSVYDSYTKSYKMQFYTVTEYYTDYETRPVTKTYYEWQTVYEKVHDIPEYTVYSFDLPKGERVLVYKTDAGYFFQNPSYYASTDTRKGFFGDVEVRITLIDADSNGSYGDPHDQVLYSAWNPYRKDAVYREVPGIEGNTWLDISRLSEEVMVSHLVDREHGVLSIVNANTRYAGSAGKGKVRVTGLSGEGVSLSFNGAPYGVPSDGTFTGEIEYGLYALRVRTRGHLDFTRSFEVNQASPAAEIDVQETPRAASFVLIHSFKSFKLTASNDQGFTVSRYNEARLELPEGSYTITVVGDGVSFQKEVSVKAGEAWEYDFGADVVRKAATER